MPARSALWLVAEDSDDDFFLLHRACSRLTPPPKLERVTDGGAAMRYLDVDGPFKENRDVHPLPLLIISDLNMPKMNGLELLAWFRAQPELQQIHFLLMTSSDSQSARGTAEQLKMDEYITKPGRFSDLVDSIQAVAQQHCSQFYEGALATCLFCLL